MAATPRPTAAVTTATTDQAAVEDVVAADEAVPAAAASDRTGGTQLVNVFSRAGADSPRARNNEFEDLPESDDPVEIRNQVSRP